MKLFLVFIAIAMEWGVENINLYREALSRLSRFIEDAAQNGVSDPGAAALATANTTAQPSVRMISVLAVEDAGVAFLASINSGKGRQMEKNPRAALCFFWPILKEQVIVEGRVEVESEAVSDSFWQRRMRERQLLAWAADQSQRSKEKGDLIKNLNKVRAKADFEPLARHPNWQAYRVIPDRIEFWPNDWRRVRERLCYRSNDMDQWVKELLDP
jgi:pyridoxamine 5'-phosphate oxidase